MSWHDDEWRRANGRTDAGDAWFKLGCGLVAIGAVLATKLAFVAAVVYVAVLALRFAGVLS